jgi:DNA-binding SARP family transcriptional activator
VRFLILGRLEIRGDAGEQVTLRAPKLRTLLAVLLLHGSKPVSAGRLEAELWPGTPPPSAAGVLRTYVAGLRDALGLGNTGQALRLATEPGGYRLVLAPGDLDLAVFDDLSARGHRALSRGDAAQAARLLSEALTLWRGEPAGDVALHGDAAAIVTALAERRLAAEEAWADAHLALGSGVGLVGKLRALATEQPLRERVHGQLMLALYRAGRKTEALEEFRALRNRTITSLGIEPSVPLQQLQRQILAGDEALTAPERSVVPRQLPPGTGDFTGRASQLGQLRALLAWPGTTAPAIAVVTGSAGAGKTALAVRFAHEAAGRFPDGQLFVDLYGHADAEPLPVMAALRRLLRALGSREVPGDTEEAAALFRSLVAGKRMLVLLDNAGSAGQVRPLLPGAAGCLAVITSRSRLPGLLARSGGTTVSVGPLAAGEAVSLLRTLLGEARVDAEPAAAGAIAARCAFLPLAVRIAAERAAHRPRMPLARLASELAAEHDRLDALTAGEDPGTAVRSVLSWSYRGLPPAAARLFRLLGLHPGPDISVAAAAALADTSTTDAARLLETLADVHLLEETAPGRYHLHDLLRAYAAERATTTETPTTHTTGTNTTGTQRDAYPAT